jgi:tetratricopeptide (TPR) repeat protein
MMKANLLFLFFSLLFPLLLSAQSLNKAKKYMDEYKYEIAIAELKKAVEIEKTKNAAIPLLAECYRLQHDIFNSKATYAKAITLPDAPPESFYYYAKMLQSTGEYSKAREMFQLYSKKRPSDTRGISSVAACDSVLSAWKQPTPFYEIKLAGNINTVQSEFGSAIYSGDLVFASDYTKPSDGNIFGWTGHGYLNIMKSHPVKTGDFWGEISAPEEFDTKLNQDYHDGPAAFGNDGKSIYFTRTYIGKAKREGIFKTDLLKIFYADRINDTWSEVKPFYLNNTDYSVGHPSLSADGQTLFFVSDMPGGYGGTDIWKCSREGDKWGKAINLDSIINTQENEMFPDISGDGVLFFASDGHPGYGSLDIFKTKYVNSQWTSPANLHPPINGPYDDFAFYSDPELKNGFFSSNRPGGIGSDDIYVFRKHEAPVIESFPVLISGFVKDKNNLEPIAGATVFLFNKVTGKVKILKTDASGMYKTSIIPPSDFVVKAMVVNHIADCTPFALPLVDPMHASYSPRDLLPEKLALNKTYSIQNIYYDFDNFTVRKDARAELDKLVRVMKENSIRVELSSHTDCRGSFEYNDKLSQKRAESAVEYIVSNGIDRNRITASGYGERKLTNSCSDNITCTLEEHQANRRTEFKVTDASITASIPEYDLSKFKGDEEIPSYSFETNFFNSCLKTKQPDAISKKEAGNAVSKPLVNHVLPMLLVPEIEENIDLPATLENQDSKSYTVQLCALRNEKSLNDPIFYGVTDIQGNFENGFYKYTSGYFKKQQESISYRAKMIQLGFHDAFVVESKH